MLLETTICQDDEEFVVSTAQETQLPKTIHVNVNMHTHTKRANNKNNEKGQIKLVDD